MMESCDFNNGNFREYSYFAGEFCSLETGIPGDPDYCAETFVQRRICAVCVYCVRVRQYQLNTAQQ